MGYLYMTSIAALKMNVCILKVIKVDVFLQFWVNFYDYEWKKIHTCIIGAYIKVKIMYFLQGKW